jgi:hypothetical protein
MNNYSLKQGYYLYKKERIPKIDLLRIQHTYLNLKRYPSSLVTGSVFLSV